MAATREICKVCYRPNAVGFTVPDSVWKQVVPEALRGSVLCLQCFTTLADEVMIAWDEGIKFYPVSLYTHTKTSGE